ncbi:HSP20-like chaperone [Leptodontidium sp. MPI-SDFR-AT-0119]|nr:HSP20-like chaperone [Leptodontidium sp. MPI-SDFR-AT-0119]
MQSIRTLSRPITQVKRVLLKPTTRNMSFFPGSFVAPRDTSFSPLFRLLEDFDNYSRTGEGQGRHRGQLRTFAPKFDVKELADSYELHGELPGIEQKDIEIEFTDASTLTIKGRSERSYTQGTPPAGFVEGPVASGAITEAEENGHHQRKGDKATVGDEKTKETTTEVAVQPAEPEAKFWVSERSVGEFSRSFTFPVLVDQDRVRASMDKGILSILVPKAKKHESRKIQIS